MPIKYIGRTTDFKGKTLWEIVGNLKNYGVGRIVIRNMLQRYPEPCFMRILKVGALPAPAKETPDDIRKVMVLVDRTFRGKSESKPIQLDATTYKADYILIPKDQEDQYSKVTASSEEVVLPRTMDLPPLLKEVILRQRKADGTFNNEELKIPIVYNQKGIKRTRIAEEGETPTIEFSLNIGKTPNPSLYANIKQEFLLQ